MSNSLVYPYSKPPAPGTLQEVAPGVMWLRMPLPMALDHINLYLVANGDDWVIVDTGIRTKDVHELWQTIFANYLGESKVTDVIVTHMHPDHVGQAGWLTEHWQVPLSMTRSEYLLSVQLTNTSFGSHREKYNAFYHQAGLERKLNDKSGRRTQGSSDWVAPLPSSYRRLRHGTQIKIGAHTWQVMVGSGHSPEHATLYCKELKVLLSGDQVLPRISPNISLMPYEPYANPLAEWYDSLEYFHVVPEDTLVLPAHHLPFYGLHKRLLSLREHHDERLEILHRDCPEGSTAKELISVMFDREMDEMSMPMALGECMAHLFYLVYEQRMTCTTDKKDVWRFASVKQMEPE